MTSDEAVQAVIDALDRVGIAYMIVGSLASNFHGIPRSTRDADFVIDLAPGELAQLASQLPDVLILDSQGAFTGTTRYVIRLVGHPFVCELSSAATTRTTSRGFGGARACRHSGAASRSPRPRT